MTPLFVNLSHPIGPKHEHREGKIDQENKKKKKDRIVE